VKEIVVISGKGGTGKTSLTGSFAALAENPVLADCDVDAADLHLILEPTVRSREAFSGGKQARIEQDRCTACGRCAELCRFDAIVRIPCEETGGAPRYEVDPVACEGCGVCAWFCTPGAMRFEDAVNGECFVSDTRFGPMVHAKLGVAEENSGKLVTLVRKRARAIAEERNAPMLIVDGSPGIGCPVIASITGADLVVIVTEPTVSGEHDLDRVAKLATHFSIPAMVCVNKADINPEVAARIRDRAAEWNLTYAGEVPYDKAMTDAQVARQTIVEHCECEAADRIRAMWGRLMETAESTVGAASD
jgi:MinD superfamily P-loop ATPase